MDTETYRVAADVEFAGAALAAEFQEDLKRSFNEIKDYRDFQAFAARFADRVVERLGDEIDDIELAIRAEVPKARYLDIETE
jgi:hypothetical protein